MRKIVLFTILILSNIIMSQSNKDSVFNKETLTKQKTNKNHELNMVYAQKKIIDTIKNELVHDGFSSDDSHFAFQLTSEKLIVNDEKQSTALHQKYINLVKSMRKTAYGKDEKWSYRK